MPTDEPNKSPILKGLNEKQQEAVLATEGPVLVYAGAGSGKTRALTHRIAYLIKEKKVQPLNILAVTFTNKAADEMKTRIQRLLGIDSQRKTNLYTFNPDIPTIGTFHAVCTRILRKHIHHIDFENTFNIYDTADQQVLMRRIMEDQGIDSKSLNPKAVLSHISSAKNELIEPKEYSEKAYGMFQEKVARLYGPYQDALKKANSLDFDDLLMKVIELFVKHKSILEQYQNQWKYIHVDEYQDTNHVQYILVKMLAHTHKNLCVIGDDNQAIYSWRGANIQNILNFEKDYKDAKIILLEQNYRSTQPILDSAHSVISKNRSHVDKKLWTDQKEGTLPKFHVAENGKHEGEIVAHKILDEIKGHERPDYRDFALLYRTNAQSRILEEVFLNSGIPYKIVGGVKFYERKEVKDIIAYLRLIQNTDDVVSLLRILNVPRRKIGAQTLETLQFFAHTHSCSIYEAIRRCDEIEGLAYEKPEALKKFTRLMSSLRSKNKEVPASSIIKFVIEETRYKKMLDDGSVEGEARLENLGELVSVASKYDNLEPGTSLSVFLEEASLLTDIDKLDDTDNAVTMMTLHQAKGLEFPWVFICGLEEGLMPHSRSLTDPQQLEEERRLMYVGMTRAMQHLHLLHAKSRMLYGETQQAVPSQFISDIPEEMILKDDEVEGSEFDTESDAQSTGFKYVDLFQGSRKKKPKRKLKKLSSSDLRYTPVPYERYE